MSKIAHTKSPAKSPKSIAARADGLPPLSSFTDEQITAEFNRRNREYEVWINDRVLQMTNEQSGVAELLARPMVMGELSFSGGAIRTASIILELVRNAPSASEDILGITREDSDRISWFAQCLLECARELDICEQRRQRRLAEEARALSVGSEAAE